MVRTDELQLLTPRLILRDFVEGDLPNVHAFRSDPEVARFIDDLLPESLGQSRSWLDAVIYHNRKRPREAYNLAIVHATEGPVIGWIGIGGSERYPEPGELGFGYMLNRAWWGRGYATEAVRAIVDLGFRVLGGQRISAWCHAENLASARVLEKAGLSFQRRYEHVEPKSRQTVDCVEYAVRRTVAPEAR